MSGVLLNSYMASSGYETLDITATAGMTLTGNGTNTAAFNCSSSGSSWTESCYTNNGFNAGFTLEFKKTEEFINEFIGLDANPTESAHYNTIDFSACFFTLASVYVFNNGTGVAVGNTGWNANTKFYWVYTASGLIQFWQESEKVYESNIGTELTLFMDSAFDSAKSGGGFTNVKIIKSAWNGTGYV